MKYVVTLLLAMFMFSGCGILDSTLPEEPEQEEVCQNLVKIYPPLPDGTTERCIDHLYDN